MNKNENILNTQDLAVEKIVELLQNELFIIKDLSESIEGYKNIIEKLYDFLKQGFEILELRTCPVYFKFKDGEDETIHTLQLRHFLTNLMLWEPLIRLDQCDLLNEKYIVDCSKISAGLIKTYIDNRIIIPLNKKFENRKLNMIISDMIYNLGRISTDFNSILGLSINIETFIDLSNRSKRFDEIIHTKLDDNLQPTENEDVLDHIMGEQIKILLNDPGRNLLQPILKSGSGIKSKQLAEFSINGGFKPDLDGNTIPIPINSNFVVGGLSNVTNYYIDSLGGRKSVIMNKTVNL